MGDAGTLWPVPFVGREDEANRLLDALTPVLSGQAARVVVILAPTGGGKTAFVEHVIPAIELRGAVVSEGKFDQVVRDVPYAAIVEALRAWLRRASLLAPLEFERIQRDLRRCLGSSAQVLGGLLPELALFLGSLPSAPTLGIQEDRNRFQFAIVALLHAMTDADRACLLFLDDVQWADEATLGLVVRICLDPGLPRVGFLLTQRTGDEAALTRTTRALAPLEGAGALLARLTLPALSAANVGELITCYRHAAAGPEFARALLARTGGNPLFVSEVLRLAAGRGSMVPEATAGMEPGGVAELLVRRIRDLEPDRQALLGAGAIMGARIDAATLATVLGQGEPAVRAWLDQAVHDAILVRAEEGGSAGVYRFRHDQLQQAALGLLPVERCRELHARFGQVLGERVVGGDTSVVFDAAYHFRLAGEAGMGDQGRLLVARVNWLCARRARLAAAERSAYEHACRGCEILGEDGWRADYPLALDLHTEAACAAFAVGEMDAFQRVARSVKEHARSFVDELPMQEVMVVALTGSGDVPAAFDLVCEGVRRFGLVLPAEPGAADLEAAGRQIDRALESMTPAWLADAPRVDDPSIVALLRLLGLGNAAAYTARPHLLRLFVALELDLSVRHGFSDVTALALAYLAALECAAAETVQHGIDARARALAAARRVTDGAILARTLDIVHGMTSTWTGPLGEAVTPLLENAQLALENGAFDYAGYSALKGCCFALLSGRPLDEVANRLDGWRRTLGGLGQRLAYSYLSRDRQVVELLRRRPAGAMQVSGAFSDEAVCWREYDAQDDHYGALYLAVDKLLLAAVSMEPAMAVDAAARLRRHAKGGYGLPHLEFGRFYEAVCMFDAVGAGQVKREEALARIDGILAGLVGYAGLVPSTFSHKIALLRALLADLRGDTESAMEAFDAAIKGGRAAGYPHEAGLAAERAVRVCERAGRRAQAGGYRMAAAEAWRAWGVALPDGLAGGTVLTAFRAAPTLAEAQAFLAVTEEARGVELLMTSVPRWLGARRAWLVRVSDNLEVVAYADGKAVRCHLANPEPPGEVPELDVVELARVATAAVTGDVVSQPLPGAGFWLLPLVFQARTHGILALDLPQACLAGEATAAAMFACAHVAAVIDAARFQASLSRQARERGQAEEALRKSESLLRNILDATRVVIYAKGLDGRFILVNRTFAELFNVGGASLAEKTDFDLFPAEVARKVRENDLQVFRTLQPLECLEIVPVGGELHTYVTVKVPLLSADGRPFAVCGVSTDITERTRIEDALRESEARYRRLHESMSDAFVRVGMDGFLVEANKAYLNMLGYTLGELSRLTYQDLTPARWHAAEARIIEEQVRPRGSSEVYEKEYRCKDGHIIPVELRTYLLTDAQGRPAGMWAIVRDVTARKRLEEQLRQREKMDAIGQLAGGVAHDFNNQLGGIMGFAEMLSESLTDPTYKRYAENIMTAAVRAADLTRQLLAFGRKGKYLSVPTDIHKEIGEVVGLLNRSIDKRIEIKQHLDAVPALVLADPTQLQNAILNLALNARDAMPQGGTLSFTSSVVTFPDVLPDEELQPGRYVQLSVTDTGVGMDAATLKRLFEPFFTTKEVGKGTGLGLASVYGTVKNHGGTIRVYSEVGHGSTFRVYLPVLEEGAALAAPDVAAVAPTGHGRILIVDDEPVILEIGALMLRKLGYEVTACVDAREALELYRKDWQSFDLVLLDMVMPKLGGRELFLALREINPGIKALLASGFSINGEAQGILDLGVLVFINKPFRLVELAQSVAKALGSSVATKCGD
jgi:PAS domain S-box-containing protein